MKDETQVSLGSHRKAQVKNHAHDGNFCGLWGLGGGGAIHCSKIFY